MKKILMIMAAVLTFALVFTGAYADDVPVMYGEEQLTALMDNLVNDIQPGTAGCAFRSTARAAELMKWGMNTEMNDDEIGTTVENIMADMTDADKAEFIDVVREVYGSYCILLTDEGEDLLRDAGYDVEEYDFSAIESVPAVEKVVECTGAFE